MFDYIKVRDELKEVDLEVQELARLLQEAKDRRNYILQYSPRYTWWESFLHILGFQIKSN